MNSRKIIPIILSCLLLAVAFAPASFADQKAPAKKHILIIMTSHGELNGTGKKTGFWFDTMATPYYVLKDAGYDVTLASISGLKPPIDPESEKDPTAATERFLKDKDAMAQLEDTVPVSSVKADPYDAIYFAGGHGDIWDFIDNSVLRVLLTSFVTKDNKIIASIGHGAIGLIGITDKNGKNILAGHKITTFTKAEETELHLNGTIPLYTDYSLEDSGATVVRGAPFKENVIQDGYLITGQNPESANKLAKVLLAALQKQGK